MCSCWNIHVQNSVFINPKLTIKKKIASDTADFSQEEVVMTENRNPSDKMPTSGLLSRLLDKILQLSVRAGDMRDDRDPCIIERVSLTTTQIRDRIFSTSDVVLMRCDLEIFQRWG